MEFYSNKEKLIFYSIPTILFTLLPFFLISGPFLSDLSISLIALIFLTYCYKRKNFNFFKKKYFYIFLVFYFYLIINSLINNFHIDSFKISFFYFRYGVFIIAIVTFLKFNKKFVKFFFYNIFLSFLFLVIDGYYQYFFGESIFGLHGGSRISSLFGDEKIMGSYLTRLWPLFFGLSIFYFKKRNIFFFILVLIFILSESLIFLSGERVAFFFINLSAIFVIIFSNKLLYFRLFTLLSSLLLIIIISYVNPSAKERIIDQTLNQMNLYNVEEKKEKKEEIYIFSKQHTHHYITAYKMFLDNKLIGVGVKNFRHYCDDLRYEVSHLSCSPHPHNTYIQILSEIGILGFLFLLLTTFYFCYYVIIHMFHKYKKRYFFNDFEVCVMSGILIYIWPFAPTGNFFNNWLSILLILYAPFLIWSLESRKVNNT